jgi:hypothetical protein
MITVAATFRSPDTACAAMRALRARRADLEHTSLLVPGMGPREVEARVPTDEGEAPGMGAAVGGVVGGALGLATASLVLPGVGPIVVAGVLAAGLAGAAGGGAAGDRLEDRLTQGLPRDELEAYKAALARDRSVVVVGVETDEDAEEVREILAAAGAERVDPVRRDWRTGLRPPGEP